MTIKIVILLLITLISIALSETTFNCLASEQSKVLSQLENTNRSALVSQLNLQINLSQREIDLDTNLITFHC